MKTPFCRVGSKRLLAKRIVPLIPKHKIYVEAFAGSGAIYFAKEPSPVEVLNDLDKNLMEDYHLLKTIKGRNFRTDLNTLPKLTAFYKQDPKTPEDTLTWDLIDKCNGFGSLPVKNDRIYKASNPYGKLKNIDEYQARLKHTLLHNQSYESILKKYDSKETFFYLDPPYEKSEGLYKDSDFDFEKLEEQLRKLKGRFLLSLNDSPNIRRIFEGYAIKPIIVKTYGNKEGVGFKGGRRELLIANYPIK